MRKISVLAFLMLFVLSTFNVDLAQSLSLNHSATRVSAASDPAITGTLYVSPTGSDSNPGTIDRPFRTISKAASVAVAGRVIYLRGGTYKEAVRVTRSGTQASPIQFVAYPGEKPVLDGGNSLPSSYNGLFSVKADWIVVSGLEVKNSAYMGIAMYGTHGTVSRTYVHHSQKSGIGLYGDYNTAFGNKVWWNSASNAYGKSSTWSTGIVASRDPKDGRTTGSVIRSNLVWENWGQGINTYESDHSLIEGNISHDNYANNIYLSDTQFSVARRNFVYMSPASPVYGLGSNVGILMGDEKCKPCSSDNQVYDNIAVGNSPNFDWYSGVSKRMVNTVIANNTFVNGDSLNVLFSSGTHSNVQFVNNIIVQDTGTLISSRSTGITFAKNIWSKTVSSGYMGKGSVVANPLFAKTGSLYSAAYYTPLANSPAINTAMILSQVTMDYNAKVRGTLPDIGAIER